VVKVNCTSPLCFMSRFYTPVLIRRTILFIPKVLTDFRYTTRSGTSIKISTCNVISWYLWYTFWYTRVIIQFYHTFYRIAEVELKLSSQIWCMLCRVYKWVSTGPFARTCTFTVHAHTARLYTRVLLKKYSDKHG